MTLVMYMKPGCPWCEEQRERFRSQGVEWEEIDAQADPAARADLIRFTDGTRTVPTVVEDGHVISVGFDGHG
jgi:monothiol glutaredoxin